MKIIDLKDGHKFAGPVIVRSIEESMTKGAKPSLYWKMEVGDRSGSIKTMRFNVPETESKSVIPGDIVYVQGPVEIFNEKLQIKATIVSTASHLLEGVVPMDLVPIAPLSEEEMRPRIVSHIKSIQEGSTILFKIVANLYNNIKGQFYMAPAAKSMHHAYYGGLAYHTLGILDMCDALCSIKPGLNPHLLKAGAAIHDFRKVEEMLHTYGVVSDYSFEGKMLGHIVMGVLGIDRICAQLQIDPQSEEVVMLQHMVASHHNLGEWGSPVNPHLPEAVALHYLDQLDAKTQAAIDSAAQTNPGTFGEKMWALEKAQMYVPKEKENPSE